MKLNEFFESELFLSIPADCRVHAVRVMTKLDQYDYIREDCVDYMQTIVDLAKDEEDDLFNLCRALGHLGHLDVIKIERDRGYTFFAINLDDKN